ncbi:MAG: TonB-dependent receptor plug domain-containing protein [Cytophagales bacterium]|nr:TonB-dependent receptor plug domain-containing protein [Cytophagales bacterium]
MPVLGIYERPLSYEQDSLTQQGSEVKLISSKKTFNPREKIKLEFAIRNEDGTPRPAELSISVTDLNQIIDIDNNKNNILTEFDLQEWNSKDYLTTEINYAIETGITLVGRYRGKKGKPEKNTFNIVIGNFSDVREVEADKQGNFKVTGLHFYDSAEIAFQSIGKAKKFEGSITWVDRVPPAMKEIKTEIKIHTKTEATIQRAQLPTVETEPTILLKEVTVNEEVDMELNKENIPQVYAKADITITGDKIREASRTSLFTALRSQVPGLNVVNGYLRIGTASNFMGASSTEPLLILDGLQFTGGGGDSNYGRLQQINPEMVDRVDVIKYGSAAMYGTRGGNGVIIITTIKGEYGSSDRFIESNLAQKQKVLGYSKAGEFFSPDYSKSRSKNYRDTRSTILWVPQIRPDDVFGLATILFYAADLITTYKIAVEGVSDLGEPIHGIFYINIQE